MKRLNKVGKVLEESFTKPETISVGEEFEY